MTKKEFITKFKVGDKIGLKGWEAQYFCQIDFIGEKKFMFHDNDGNEHYGTFEYPWIKWVSPKEKAKSKA